MNIRPSIHQSINPSIPPSNPPSNPPIKPSIHPSIINSIILSLQLAAQLTIVGDFHPSQYQICLYACKCVREGEGELKLTLNRRRKGEFNCDSSIMNEEDKNDLN